MYAQKPRQRITAIQKGNARDPRPAAPLSFVRPAALLFLLALALRLIYLAELSASPLGEHLLGDGIAYDAWARRIVAGDWLGNQVFYQSPFYPYFLSLVYALPGADFFSVRILQAILGAASCVLIAVAGMRFFGHREGLAAGYILAAYPPAIFFGGEIQKASLDLLFSAILLLLIAGLRERPAVGRVLATGVISGLFALNRENALLLIPLLTTWVLLLRGPSMRRRVVITAIFLAGVCGTLLPVALRNRVIGGEFLLTTSQLGPNFYIGNHRGASGRYQPLRAGRGSAQYEREDAIAIAEAATGTRLTPAQVSRYWMRRALEFVRDEPAQWAALLARKWFLVWNRREIVDTTSIETAADFSRLLSTLNRILHFGVLCPLAAAGIWLTRRRWRELSILYLLLAGWALSVTAFYVLARYRYPLAPLLALFAGAALVEITAEIVTAWRRRELRPILPALAVALLVALFVNWPLGDRDPRAPTYAALGNAMADAGQVEEGARMLERAVTLSPQFAEAHLSLGHLRFQSGALDPAEASYRATLALDPTSAPAWNNLGAIAIQRGQNSGAMTLFRRAMAADAQYAPAVRNLARTTFESGDLNAAFTLYEQLMRLDDRDAEGHHQLANLYAYRGNLAASRHHYERALALDPSRADAHFKLAVILDRLGVPIESERHMVTAIQLQPGYAQRGLRLAAAAEQQGRPADAARLYRQILAAKPGDAEALRGLARSGSSTR